MHSSDYFLNPDFWKSPILVFIFFGSVIAVVFLRYWLFSFGYGRVIGKIMKSAPRNFSKTSSMQIKKEIRWAFVSTVIFAAMTCATLWLYQQGYTKIYTNLHQHSMLYFVASIFGLLIGYETYYYWLHRWMHKPSVFRHVHKVHHDSIHTSVFTSFSFHPLEAFLQFIFLPLILFVMPVHIYAVGIVLTLMTLSAIINHASVEIFPARFHKHRLGRWLIGATHHDLHHKEFKSNFGLYFTFWDKWMKTESARFEKQFEQNTESVNQSR